MAVVWVAAVAAMVVGGVRLARQRADAAADLAALAGAGRVAEGPRAACRKAAGIARESGGRLARCVVSGRVVEVSVAVSIDAAFGIHDVKVVSRARAGPVEPEGIP
jgi:secretion/DNA translocation related TadE-like protein